MPLLFPFDNDVMHIIGEFSSMKFTFYKYKRPENNHKTKLIGTTYICEVCGKKGYCNQMHIKHGPYWEDLCILRCRKWCIVNVELRTKVVNIVSTVETLGTIQDKMKYIKRELYNLSWQKLDEDWINQGDIIRGYEKQKKN